MGYIYHLKDEDEIVYVGQSVNKKGMMGRFSSHCVDKEFDDTSFYEVDDDKLDQTEADEIIKYTPKYNTSLPTNMSSITITDICCIARKKIEEAAVNSNTLFEIKGYRRLSLEKDFGLSISITRDEMLEFLEEKKVKKIEKDKEDAEKAIIQEEFRKQHLEALRRDRRVFVES